MLLWVGLAGGAKASPPMPIYIDSTSNDSVGQTLSYAIRERVRRSASMALAAQDRDAKIVLRIVTIDPDQGANSAQNMTVYSATITMWSAHNFPLEVYLNSRVGLCGAQRIEQCALRITAQLDEEVTQLRAVWRQFGVEPPKN
jgi:hypothetical protein